MNIPPQNSITFPIALSIEKSLGNQRNIKLKTKLFPVKTKTYFTKVNVPLFIAIISVNNNTHRNDISNSIMFGMQHNLRHFQGEVGFTKIDILLIIIIENS